MRTVNEAEPTLGRIDTCRDVLDAGARTVDVVPAPAGPLRRLSNPVSSAGKDYNRR